MSEKNKTKKNATKKGFVMMEAAFATFILGVTFLVFLTVLGRTTQNEFRKRDLIIASNLAQEGIEIVRQQRDNNWKNGCNAFGGVATPGCNPSHFGGLGQTFPPVSNWCGDHSRLFIWNCGDHILRKNNNGFYQHQAGTASKFSRFISISGAGESRLVTVKVTWEVAEVNVVTTKEVIIADTLYAWGDAE